MVKKGRSVFLFFLLLFSAHFVFAQDNFIFVGAGSFVMGSHLNERGRGNSETPHRVHVKAFYMSQYQITQEEYEALMGNNPSFFTGSNLPVETVSWFDAIEYCNRRSLQEGLNPVYTINVGRIDLKNRNSAMRWLVTWNQEANGYRLPTEAEWEYAAKGGNETPGDFLFSGSNTQTEVAWYAINSGGAPHPVGTKDPNKIGLHDMSGNVWEWCWDWYGELTITEQFAPTGADAGTHRVIRGGSWADSAAYIRSAYRNSTIPSNLSMGLGFRIVRSALRENWTEFLLIK
jgi:formylglycine-generating enzyme required for sulfatase activity